MVIVHFKQFCTKYFSSEQQLRRLYCDVVVGSFCPLESTISRKIKECATNQHIGRASMKEQIFRCSDVPVPTKIRNMH